MIYLLLQIFTEADADFSGFKSYLSSVDIAHGFMPHNFFSRKRCALAVFLGGKMSPDSYFTGGGFIADLHINILPYEAHAFDAEFHVYSAYTQTTFSARRFI